MVKKLSRRLLGSKNTLEFVVPELSQLKVSEEALEKALFTSDILNYKSSLA